MLGASGILLYNKHTSRFSMPLLNTKTSVFFLLDVWKSWSFVEELNAGCGPPFWDFGWMTSSGDVTWRCIFWQIFVKVAEEFPIGFVRLFRSTKVVTACLPLNTRCCIILLICHMLRHMLSVFLFAFLLTKQTLHQIILQCFIFTPRQSFAVRSFKALWNTPEVGVYR